MGDLIQKSSVQITRRLCEQLISGDPRGLQTSSNPLLQDVYVQMRTRLLRPAVIVDYAREAYLHPAEGWPVVNGPFIGSLQFNRLLLPFVLSALLMVLGLGLLMWEYFRKD